MFFSLGLFFLGGDISHVPWNVGCIVEATMKYSTYVSSLCNQSIKKEPMVRHYRCEYSKSLLFCQLLQRNENTWTLIMILEITIDTRRLSSNYQDEKVVIEGTKCVESSNFPKEGPSNLSGRRRSIFGSKIWGPFFWEIRTFYVFVPSINTFWW